MVRFFDNADRSNLLSGVIELAPSSSKPGESSLLASISSPQILVSINIYSPVKASSLNLLMDTLCVLRNADPEQQITLTSDEAANISMTRTLFRSETNEPYAIQGGSSVSIGTVLTLYLVTGESAYRDVLTSNVFGSEDNFSAELRYISKKLKTLNTHYDSTTTAYDLYLLANELLLYDMFPGAVSADFTEFTCIQADGSPCLLQGRSTVESQNYNRLLPNDYSLSGRVGDEVLLISDVLGTDYMAILSSSEFVNTFAGLPSNPSEKANAVIDSDEIPQKAVIPTGSDPERYEYIFGKDEEYRYFTVYDKPKGYGSASAAKSHMKTITVPCWKIENGKRVSSTYSLTVNKKLVNNVQCIFEEIYDLDIKFPIKYMSGYGYRKVGGVALTMLDYMSIHSFGCAIDINPGDYDNDLYVGYGQDLRDKSNPYCIPDEVIEIFAKYGWNWGGNFSICSDTMHFQYLGLGYLQYSADDTFPLVELTSPLTSGEVTDNLQMRLNKLGYLDKNDMSGYFDTTTWNALKAFQRDNDISPSGTTDYKTWERIINLTHDQPYVF